jgi:uncharacterized protein (UPF0548 family)
MKRLVLGFIGLVAVLSLGACGGGGGGGSTAFGTKQMGTSGADTYGLAVATDANGDVYVTGYTTGGLDGHTLTGTEDFFLAKYDSTGHKLYTKQMGVTGAYTEARSVATDANGNVYVAGDTDGDLDGHTLTGTEDFFLTKYDSAGKKVYTRLLGVTGAATYAASVAADGSGNVYVAGGTDGGLDGNSLTGTYDFFLTEYDSAGSKQYTKQMGVTGVDTHATGVATDSNGNVYVGGTTYGGLDGNSLTGTADFFLTKYDSAGAKQYTKQMGVTGVDTYGYAIATDTSNDVYVAGLTFGGLDGNTLNGHRDSFFTEYTSTGGKVATHQFGAAGATGDAPTYGIATDANGSVYVTGYTNGSLDGNTLTGVTDAFLTRYDSAGNEIYTKQMGATGDFAEGDGVATDSNGNVYIGGVTDGGLDGNSLTGTNDFFLAKYDSAGNKL